MKKYKIGITFGSFNPIHYGHIFLLQKSKEYCEHLIVGIDSDEYLKDGKRKTLLHTLDIRKKLIKELRCVNSIMVQSITHDKRYWLSRFKNIFGENAICLLVGDDHQNTSWDGETIAKELSIELIYIPHTKEIHSTQIRDLLIK